MLLNVIKGLTTVLFPLISFPYISRILGVENIGRYSFANVVVGYFVLAAGLGISTYAIREGASFRNDNDRLANFANDMLTISIISSVVAYFAFIVTIIICPLFKNHALLFIILSIQILSKSISIDWIYAIHENYVYTTIRSFIIQFLSVTSIFLFVKTRDDVYVYAVISTITVVCVDVLNLTHSRIYYKARLSPLSKVNWIKHIKPILIMFAMTATVVVYVNSDITMLGIMCSDYDVGVYAVSTKVYGIVKSVLSAILIVSIPHISSLLACDEKKDFSDSANRIYKTLITFTLPAIVGILMLRKQIIEIMAGTDYLAATSSLFLLGIALFFCMGAWFWGQCIMVPFKMEEKVFRITAISAILNIVLNIFFIHVWKEKGAALTTIIAEGVSYLYCSIIGHSMVEIKDLRKCYFKAMLGCAVVASNVYFLKIFRLSELAYMFLAIASSIVLYIIVEMLIKNEIFKKNE